MKINLNLSKDDIKIVERISNEGNIPVEKTLKSLLQDGIDRSRETFEVIDNLDVSY